MIQLPPTVHVNLFFSILFGRSVATTWIYVAFLCVCFAWWRMKNIVFVPLGTRVPTPWDNWPISFACAVFYLAPLLPQRRAPISSILPVAGSILAPAKREHSDLTVWVAVWGLLPRYCSAKAYMVDFCGCPTGWAPGRCVGGRMRVGGCLFFVFGSGGNTTINLGAAIRAHTGLVTVSTIGGG